MRSKALLLRSGARMKFPSEQDFLEKLGIEPIDSKPEDGYWCYELPSEHVPVLRFSFNVHEGSVQTSWQSGAEVFATVVHEGALELRVTSTSIHVDFEASAESRRTSLELIVVPRLETRWSSIWV